MAAVAVTSAFGLPVAWTIASAPTTAVAEAPATLEGSLRDGLTRANLVSYVWRDSTEAGPVWLALAAILSLVLLACLIFPSGEAPVHRTARLRWAAGNSLATFGFATAIALAYALVVPPFQAADEPAHLASFAAINQNPSLTMQAEEWSRRTHADRIAKHSGERFRPMDVGIPWPAVPEFKVQLTPVRSRISTLEWIAIGRALPGASARRVFFVVRVVNALAFGFAVGLAAALATLLTTVRYPQLLAFPYFFVPTLPFFGMHFGESALLTSVYVIFSALLAILLLEGSGVDWVGIPLGATSMAILGGARNSLPMTVMVGTVLLLRIVLGSPGEHWSRRLLFWGGLGTSASAGALILYSNVPLSDLGLLMPDTVGQLLAWMVTWWVPLIGAAAGYAVETLIGGLRAKVVASVGPRTATASMVFSTAVGVAIVVSMLGSLWWQYPDVEGIMRPGPPSLQNYLVQVATTAVTMFRLKQSSFLLATSFWAGFGWLDTMPFRAFVPLLVTLTAISTIFLLLHRARAHDLRRLLWLLICGGGLAATMGIYAVAAHQAAMNLHGRYLIGWYLAAIAICWTAPVLADARRETRRAPFLCRPTPYVVLAAALHTYCLAFILRRYF